MSSGLMEGEKVRSSFTEDDGAGTRKGGTIIEPFPFKRQKRDYDTGEPMTWDDGNPRQQFVVTVQTDLDEGPDDEGTPDDGRRRFYFDKPSDLLKVTQAAIRSAWAGVPAHERKLMDFEIGATFFVTRTGKGEAKKTAGGGKRKAPWLHSVEYARPSKGQTGSGAFDSGPAATVAHDDPPF